MQSELVTIPTKFHGITCVIKVEFMSWQRIIWKHMGPGNKQTIMFPVLVQNG